MAVSAQDVQKLRESTGAGMMAAKKALDEAKGDMDKAVELLRKRGEAKASERSGRGTSEGAIGSYIHSNNKVAAMVELRCETDFVARTPEFMQLARDIAMHVTASNPKYLQPTDVPADEVAKEKEIIVAQLAEQKIPEKAQEKALEGKLQKVYAEICLLQQPFVKDPDKTVGQLVTETATKTGENIHITRFVRFTI